MGLTAVSADLLMRKVPFIPLSGTLEERVARVKAVLARYGKFENLGGRLRWD